ncbi:hypothetical protein PILCRDRAFT_16622 [Piloderma croceum F 1598]|uniref:Uncharacterized protein n=1 Tax=Piloderma croceum (strain F 1598) TaxID=765440 RepID=A0A0C3B3M9_PILCF|nr:hypothetical protein PILCRDRAFT_16622 [Piloderma croceum F 1598]
MSAFQQSTIANFWVAIGEYPLLHRNFPGDISALNIIETLLSGANVALELEDSALLACAPTS